MPWTRRLPPDKDGVQLWASTVRTPAGRRTKSDISKGVVEKWALDLEADIRRGEFLDPYLARTPIGEVWRRYAGSRTLERASRLRDESHWKNWVEPKWGKDPVGSVLKPDIQEWVNKLRDDKVGGWTIIAALNVTKAVFELAVDAGMIRANPARRVKPPVAPQHEDRIIEADEERLILERLDELFPGRRDARLFVEGLAETGARWEELAAVRRESVNLKAGLISLGPVMERDGTIREYPKGARDRNHPGFRDAPIGDEYLARLKPIVLATPARGLIYTASKGGPLFYSTWRTRVWVATLRVPVFEDGKRVGWEPLIEEPLPTPHDLRHRYGTALADSGMELHDRMRLMGHKDVRSSQRYTHSGEARFDKAREALRRARGA